MLAIDMVIVLGQIVKHHVMRYLFHLSQRFITFSDCFLGNPLKASKRWGGTGSVFARHCILCAACFPASLLVVLLAVEVLQQGSARCKAHLQSSKQPCDPVQQKGIIPHPYGLSSFLDMFPPLFPIKMAMFGYMFPYFSIFPH